MKLNRRLQRADKTQRELGMKYYMGEPMTRKEKRDLEIAKRIINDHLERTYPKDQSDKKMDRALRAVKRLIKEIESYDKD